MLTIISGGQTGVDRAALDFAMARGYSHGGWCPNGRRAEDGVIDARYQLTEAVSKSYHSRTRRNVLDSDGTLILNSGELENGTLKALQIAEHENRPVWVIQLDSSDCRTSARECLSWLGNHAIVRLNIAAPRESKRPSIYKLTAQFLDEFHNLANASSPEITAR